jgi:flagella basal body P-ring formation protein FlgA
MMAGKIPLYSINQKGFRLTVHIGDQVNLVFFAGYLEVSTKTSPQDNASLAC